MRSKYNKPGGRIRLAARVVNCAGEMIVGNAGDGTPKERTAQLFERFYRADEARSRNGGAGLGLSIAQMIAHAHRSRIEVESTPGTGSCFHLTLQA